MNFELFEKLLFTGAFMVGISLVIINAFPKPPNNLFILISVIVIELIGLAMLCVGGIGCIWSC